jgi:hypothetical protein
MIPLQRSFAMAKVFDFQFLVFAAIPLSGYRSGDPLPFATTRRVKITESGTYLAKVINISGVYRYSDSVTAEAISLPQPWIAKRNDTLYSSSDAYNQWYREGVAIQTQRIVGSGLHPLVHIRSDFISKIVLVPHPKCMIMDYDLSQPIYREF